MIQPSVAPMRPATEAKRAPPETLAEAIDALESTERGFHFTHGSDDGTFTSHAALRQRARDMARRLLGAGCRPGEAVVLLTDSQADFVPLFLAAMRAGLIVVPRSPPMPGAKPEEFAAGLNRAATLAGGRTILISAALARDLAPHLQDFRCVTPAELEGGRPTGDLCRPRPGDTALIQFTSGSSGAPKAVALSHRNLISNARAIVAALALDPARDVGVSWLPLHHDMGLIGFLVTPVLIEGTNWYMSPRDFAARPQRWLDLMSRTRATISFAPTFGYDHAARRIRSEDAETWDLSNWRVAGCGGEPISPQPLNRFADLLAETGFRRTAFTPCYGLAEATLAVTVPPLGRGLLVRDRAKGADATQALVSCGLPVEGAEIRLTGPDGAVLAEGEEGEIEIRGPSVAASVRTDEGPDGSDRGAGWRATGDIGVVSGGELYVSGRLKEVIIHNGQNLFPQEIEQAVRGFEGVARENAIAFGRPGPRGEEIVLAVEAKPGVEAADLQRRLRERVRLSLGLSLADVVVVGRGCISRTTSGKLRRVELRRRYLAGGL